MVNGGYAVQLPSSSYQADLHSVAACYDHISCHVAAAACWRLLPPPAAIFLCVHGMHLLCAVLLSLLLLLLLNIKIIITACFIVQWVLR